MVIYPKTDKNRYLQGLREQLDSWTAFGQQRFTGLVLGTFFYITSHAGYEWDHRISNQKSRAIGFATDCENGWKVSMITTRGYFDPVSMLLWYLFAMTYFLARGVELSLKVHIAAAACALLIGVGTFVADWFTERGQENMRDLITLLQDPVLTWDEQEV